MGVGDFQGFLGAAYPWVKAAHVTFAIFWIAGLFIVPRYYIHHQATTPAAMRYKSIRTFICMPPP